MVLPARASPNKLEAQFDSATEPFRYTNGTVKSAHMHPGWHRSQKRPCAGRLRIADGTNRPWSVGDNENLAVGQGDVQGDAAVPAVAYAALENDGTIVTPHLGLTSRRRRHRLQTIDPKPARHIDINRSLQNRASSKAA